MKRRALAESILKSLNIQATDALLLAVDKEIEKADDEKDDDEKAADEKDDDKAEDESASVSAGPKEGERGKSITADALPAMLAGYVTSEQAAQMASDAASKAVTQAVARVNALHKAREDVKPLVGIVAMDSAEAVYRFALEQSKVALDGVPEAAFGALVEQVKARKAAPAAAGAAPKFASDSASAAAAAIPGLGRFNAA